MLTKLREFFGLSEQEKVALDRRAFLRGMVVTSAGLLVPGPVVFDLGRRIIQPDLKPDGNGDVWPPAVLHDAAEAYTGDFRVGDLIRIHGTDNQTNEGVYLVTGIDRRGLNSVLTLQS